MINEIRKLIDVRQEHKAVGNLGEIEFFDSEKKNYPMIYVRSNDDEKILVIINPFNRKFDIEPALEVKEMTQIYSYEDKELIVEGKLLHIPEMFAAFYKIK